MNIIDRIIGLFRRKEGEPGQDELTWLSHLLIGTGAIVLVHFFAVIGASIGGTIWAFDRERKHLKAGGSLTDGIGDLLGYLVGFWVAALVLVPWLSGL